MAKEKYFKSSFTFDKSGHIELGRNYFHISRIASIWKDETQNPKGEDAFWVKLMLENREFGIASRTTKERDSIYNSFKKLMFNYTNQLAESSEVYSGKVISYLETATKQCKGVKRNG